MTIPSITPLQLKLLEKLCNAIAVSGDEGEVRQIVLEEVKPFADEVKIDAMGSVLVKKAGTGENRVRVMLDAHMDEVGFMLVGDDGDGIFRFETVGGIDVRQLVGKQVLVGRAKTPGVIGARPIHLTSPEERQRKIPLDQLRIDIGPGGKAKVGERAGFATQFRRVGPSIFAKAIDNRIGCAILIDLLKNASPNVDLCLSFSVQEEIGLRGAKVAAHAFNPDMAIAIDSTPANDLPTMDGSENIFYNTKLGLVRRFIPLTRGRSLTLGWCACLQTRATPGKSRISSANLGAAAPTRAPFTERWPGFPSSRSPCRGAMPTHPRSLRGLMTGKTPWR